MCVRIKTLCVVLTLLSAGHVTASTDDLSYRIIRQPVVEFFSELSAFSGQRIVLSEGVTGTVRNMTLSGTFEEVVAKIATERQLDVFHFNRVTYISAKSEAVTRLTRLGTLSSDDVVGELAQVGLLHDSYPVATAAGGTAVVLSGPPKLLALSEAIIETIPDAPEVLPAPEPVIVVRRGTERQIVGLDGSVITEEFGEPEDVSSSATN